ncbi:MAG: ThuA domain-containing protein [Saprospiraceae bacterium]
MKILLAFSFLFMLDAGICQSPVGNENADGFKVLVFSKTAGYRHQSIPDGHKALRALGAQNGFEVTSTEDAALFTEETLAQYAVVVFLNTTLDVLGDAQQTAFENYIRSGGGYVGIHAAADTEYDWPWYGKLAGAYFDSHPKIQEAAVHVKNHGHPACKGIPVDWKRTDEWYNFKSLNDGVKVLMMLDETTYDGGKNGTYHPIAWYHEYDGGRAFYTGMGHTSESYSEPFFLQHVLGGILYAAGK